MSHDAAGAGLYSVNVEPFVMKVNTLCSVCQNTGNDNKYGLLYSSSNQIHLRTFIIICGKCD